MTGRSVSAVRTARGEDDSSDWDAAVVAASWASVVVIACGGAAVVMARRGAGVVTVCLASVVVSAGSDVAGTVVTSLGAVAAMTLTTFASPRRLITLLRVTCREGDSLDVELTYVMPPGPAFAPRARATRGLISKGFTGDAPSALKSTSEVPSSAGCRRAFPLRNFLLDVGELAFEELREISLEAPGEEEDEASWFFTRTRLRRIFGGASSLSVVLESLEVAIAESASFETRPRLRIILRFKVPPSDTAVDPSSRATRGRTMSGSTDDSAPELGSCFESLVSGRLIRLREDDEVGRAVAEGFLLFSVLLRLLNGVFELEEEVVDAVDEAVDAALLLPLGTRPRLLMIFRAPDELPDERSD